MLTSAALTASTATMTSQKSPPAQFTATPLTDFSGSQLYLNQYAGVLYDGSNDLATSPTGQQHDIDAKSAASAVVKVDSEGKPSPTGKIGVVALGMSNWTDEICVGLDASRDPASGCVRQHLPWLKCRPAKPPAR